VRGKRGKRRKGEGRGERGGRRKGGGEKGGVSEKKRL
jgi:hypothetical protein